MGIQGFTPSRRKRDPSPTPPSGCDRLGNDDVSGLGEQREMSIEVAIGQADLVADLREIGSFDAAEEGQDSEPVTLMHGFVEFADRSRRLVVAHSVDDSDRIVNKAAIATVQLTIPVARYEICSSRPLLLMMRAIAAIRFAAATIPTRGLR